MWTWKENTKHCNIPPDLYVIVSDSMTDNGAWIAAGRILERLSIHSGSHHRCGPWLWLEFDDIKDTMLFKLAWEKQSG